MYPAREFCWLCVQVHQFLCNILCNMIKLRNFHIILELMVFSFFLLPKKKPLEACSETYFYQYHCRSSENSLESYQIWFESCDRWSNDKIIHQFHFRFSSFPTSSIHILVIGYFQGSSTCLGWFTLGLIFFTLDCSTSVPSVIILLLILVVWRHLKFFSSHPIYSSIIA